MKAQIRNIFYIIFLIIPLSSAITFISCDDSGIIPKKIVSNPNVRTFDSIGVVEFINQQSMNCIDLLNGVTVNDSSYVKDVDLTDSNNTGVNFYLQSGDISLLDITGYSARFYRFYPNLTAAQFDTITVLDAGSTLDSLDFTQDNTIGINQLWEYFNTPLTTYPVYGVFLRGKYNSGVTTKPVYGILQPREATDSTSNIPGGYRMSFRVRININGDNDFRQTIEQ